MPVVSDTTPINYLTLIREGHLLQELFGEVVLPEEVALELVKPKGPWRGLADGLSGLPDGMRIAKGNLRSSADAEQLQALDDGEREAILLAERLGASVVLMDEKAGRRVAGSRGLKPRGTLGILDEAGRDGLVDVPQAVAALRQTTFRASPDLYE